MNPAMKRLVKELAEINNESDSVIAAQPLHVSQTRNAIASCV